MPYETTILIGCIICTPISRPIEGTETNALLKNYKHPRQILASSTNIWPPRIPLHEPSSFNFNHIWRPWCQTIGKWGQESQFSGQIQEIFIEKSNFILNKSVNQQLILLWSAKSALLPAVFGGKFKQHILQLRRGKKWYGYRYGPPYRPIPITDTDKY